VPFGEGYDISATLSFDAEPPAGRAREARRTARASPRHEVAGFRLDVLRPGNLRATFATIAGVRMPSCVQPMISVGAPIRARSALRSNAGLDDILSGSRPSPRVVAEPAPRKRSSAAVEHPHVFRVGGAQARRLDRPNARPLGLPRCALRAMSGLALAHVAGLAATMRRRARMASGELERYGGAIAHPARCTAPQSRGRREAPPDRPRCRPW